MGEQVSLLKFHQVEPASIIARKAQDLKAKVHELKSEAERAGLHEAASELDSVREHLYEISDRLEREARNAYVAVRRGESLPK